MGVTRVNDPSVSVMPCLRVNIKKQAEYSISSFTSFGRILVGRQKNSVQAKGQIHQSPLSIRN